MGLKVVVPVKVVVASTVVLTVVMALKVVNWLRVARNSKPLVQQRFSKAGRHLAYHLWGQGLPPRSPPQSAWNPQLWQRRAPWR